MNYYKDPHGIYRAKEIAILENKRIEKTENTMLHMISQLRSISEKLERIEKKLNL